MAILNLKHVSSLKVSTKGILGPYKCTFKENRFKNQDFTYYSHFGEFGGHVDFFSKDGRQKYENHIFL